MQKPLYLGSEVISQSPRAVILLGTYNPHGQDRETEAVDQIIREASAGRSEKGGTKEALIWDEKMIAAYLLMLDA